MAKMKKAEVKRAEAQKLAIKEAKAQEASYEDPGAEGAGGGAYAKYGSEKYVDGDELECGLSECVTCARATEGTPELRLSCPDKSVISVVHDALWGVATEQPRWQGRTLVTFSAAT